MPFLLKIKSAFPIHELTPYDVAVTSMIWIALDFMRFLPRNLRYEYFFAEVIVLFAD